MIIVENLETAERRYSDQNVKIRNVEDGTLWNDAVNAIPCPYTYEETDVPLDPPDPDDIEAKAEAYDILMGVSV